MATINPEEWTPGCDQHGRPFWFSDGQTFFFQRRLSESLYGAVYQAVQGNCPDLNEPPTFLMPVRIEDQTHVAVKRSSRAKIRAQENVFREISIMRALSEGDDHRHVVTLVEACMSEFHVYLVTPYCGGGGPHGMVLPGDGMGEANAVKCFGQILRGLSYVHSKGLRHHDLSPENVMLDYKGDGAVVIDFGMVLKMPAHDSAPFGKNRYMAPEMYRNKAYDGLKIDIWSIGVTLLMCLSGDYLWAAAMRTPLLSRGIYFDPSRGKVPKPRDWRRLAQKDEGPAKELKCGTTGEVFETRKPTMPTDKLEQGRPTHSEKFEYSEYNVFSEYQGTYDEAEPSSLADDALDSTAAKVQVIDCGEGTVDISSFEVVSNTLAAMPEAEFGNRTGFGNSGDSDSPFLRAVAISEASFGPDHPTAATKGGSGKTAGKNIDKGVGQWVSMIDQVGRRYWWNNTTGAWTYGSPSIEEVDRVYHRRQGLNEWSKRASRGKSATCASSVLGVIAAASYVPGVAATETFGERIGSMVSPECVESIVSPECLESIGSAILHWLCHALWWAHVLIVTLAGMVIYTSMVFSIREMKAGNAKFWAAWRESLRVKQAAAARRQGHPRASR